MKEKEWRGNWNDCILYRSWGYCDWVCSILRSGWHFRAFTGVRGMFAAYMGLAFIEVI
jgi:hypothetical protein